MPDANQIALAIRELGDLAVLREAAQDFETRVPSTKPLPLLDYKPADSNAEDVLVGPGTVTLFLFRAKSPMLERVRTAVQKADGTDLELMRDLKAAYRKRQIMSLPKAVELLRRQAVIAALEYSGHTVSRYLFVPDDLELCMTPLPWNGGLLAETGFQLVQASRGLPPYELDGFMVRSTPSLSAAEARAIALLDEEMTQFNVGDSMCCWAATAITIVAVVIFATVACPGIYQDLHIGEEEIRRLGPVATSRQLLNLRREILQKEYAG